MLILPIESQDHKNDMLILILDNSNLERMATGDPAEVCLRKSGRTLVNPTIMVCREESTPKFTQLLNSGNLSEIVQYLQRGWKFRPDKGDHDRGPESLKGMN